LPNGGGLIVRTSPLPPIVRVPLNKIHCQPLQYPGRSTTLRLGCGEGERSPMFDMRRFVVAFLKSALKTSSVEVGSELSPALYKGPQCSNNRWPIDITWSQPPWINGAFYLLALHHYFVTSV